MLTSDFDFPFPPSQIALRPLPRGEARLRVQVSAALEPHHIERVLDAFAKL